MAQIASNLGCGLLRLFGTLGTRGLLLAAYAWLHARFALVRLDPADVASWVAALVAYDFVYYWVHRLSHRVPFLWAAHAVHHQATELEPSVLFRAPILAPLQTFPAYALLAIAGVPTAMFVTVAVIVHAAMFWLHTERVREPGVAGLVLNTPSHHRVHHSASERESRANYGGMFVIWDRLFGTFRGERTRVRSFGIGSEPAPLGPVAANVLPWVELAQRLRAAPTFRQKLRALFVGSAIREQSLARNVIDLEPDAVRIFE